MLIEVKVPQLSESVSEATLVTWHKKEGDAVARDENLIDIETDKVVLELPAPAATPRYLAAITEALTERGWTEALPPSKHPGGRTLTKDGVTAVYYRNVDVAGRGALQIYGECRDVTDHRSDPTGWIDITAELRR